MFEDHVVINGTCGGEEYIFHFHETYESGKFYYLWYCCPVLGLKIEGDLWFYTTYRTLLDTKGSFRSINTATDGIQYEGIVVHKTDKYVVCTNENMEEKYEEWLGMFVEDELYKKIPEIKELIKDYPNLLI